MIGESYSKKLCMIEIRVERAHQRYNHVFDATAGKVNSSFGFISKGSTILCPIGKTIQVPEGSLIYIPDGVRYHSIWTGNPEIEQYCIHMTPNRLNPDAISDSFPIQVIEELSTPQTGEIFKEIHRLFSTQDRINRIRALGLYFEFYADALLYMKQTPPVNYNPIVIAAIDYIEKNYMRDFSIDDLAQFCHASASRLYHLFQKELSITPTKYRNEIRIEKAAAMIRHSALSMEEVAALNGFSSVSYFREVFKAHTGITPAEYRANL